MNHHITSWKLVGLWQWDHHPRFYKLYILIVSILFYILFPFLMAVQLFYIEDLSELMDIIMILPTVLGGLKGLLIVQKRHMILEVFDILRQLDDQLTTDRYRDLVASAIKRSRRIIRTLIVWYFTTVISGYISPLLKPEMELMWVSWFPFDTSARRDVYHLVLLYQFIATLYMATIIQSTDVFGGSIYCIVGAHLDVLGERITALGARSEFSKLSYDEHRRKYRKKQWMLMKRSESQLNDCIKTHLLCIK